MNTFDYLATLVSIILGLGITHLLTNVYRLIQNHKRIKFYWLPIVWVVLMFLAIVQWWWGFYGYYEKTNWNFFLYTFVLITPVTMYLTAGLVLPNIETSEHYNLRTYYYQNHKWFFLLAAVNPLFDALRSVLFSGKLFSVSQIVNLIGSLLFVSLAVIKNEGYHTMMTIILSTIFLSFIITLSLRL